MLFHTWVFLVFFLIVYPVYCSSARTTRLMNIWLMLASYTFYGWWNPWYLLLLFGTSAIDYCMVLLMERKQSTRKLWLIISLVSNFGFLGYFKYSGFITDNLNALLAQLGLVFELPDPAVYPNAMLGFLGVPDDWLFTKVILPIGISFHTFQSMSYTIDAYFGHDQDGTQLHALPDLRLLLPAARGRADRAGQQPAAAAPEDADASRGRTSPTACRCSWSGSSRRWRWPTTWPSTSTGFTAIPASSSAPALILATFAFGWQIYFDFSGYTDMARGIAEMMGFRLMLNFNNPYTATGLGDFWNRWHISLSTWFKDYVYFPLGGSRGGTWQTYRNMFITMVISGIWHGADWTLRHLGRPARPGPLPDARAGTDGLLPAARCPRLVKQMLVFAFVTFTWIFFRAQSLSDAWLIISRIFTTGWARPAIPAVDGGPGPGRVDVPASLHQRVAAASSCSNGDSVQVGLAVFMIAYLVIVAQPSTKQFIYFQF